MRVLVTGANGFVGRAVLRDLETVGHDVVAAVRTPDRLAPQWRSRAKTIADLGPDTDWSAALKGVEGVIHLAGPADPGGLTDDAVNRAIISGTKRLLEAAARQDVRRFVFMSSVKAVGDATPAVGVDEAVTPTPNDAYGRAKLAAERLLAAADLEVAILRPPPTYGPGSGGNLRRIIEFLRTAPPVLPLGIAGNRRSFLHRDNLASATLACLEHPQAAGRTFFVTDGEALSTGQLTRRILDALGRRAVLLPVPAIGLRALGSAGRRLGGSCAFDDSALRDGLGWKPVTDPRVGMVEAVHQATDPLLAAGDGGPAVIDSRPAPTPARDLA